MIYYLSGVLKDKAPTNLVIDVQGVGYELKIPLSTYEKLPERDKQCSLFTYLYLNMNQDEMKLYGFSSLAEKNMFVKLIGISGIGPKIALSIISSMNVSMIIKAIQKEEDGLLAKVPGIGKKTAQRIIIELKDKVLDFADYLDASEKSEIDSSALEVEKALVALGYHPKDIHKALQNFNMDERALPVEQKIKLVIKNIYSKI